MNRSPSSRFCLYLTAFCFWSAPLCTFAAVCTTAPVVTNTSDSGAGSLRDAIATACDSSTITFSNSTSGGATNFYDGTARTITLTSGVLLLTRNVTITGPGSDQLAISGNDASRIFFINPGAPGATSGPPATSINVDISGLALVHGKAKGGNGESEICAGGAGGAAGMGGAIFVNNGALALSGMTFNNNQALGGTGGTSLSGTFCTSGGGGGGVGGNGSNGTGGGGGALGGVGGGPGSVGAAAPSGGDGAGGGGGANSSNAGTNGGAGGYGGGGGGGYPGGGAGGFGGGHGGVRSGGGGGGDGMGGAIFLRAGSLTAQCNTTFSGNSATAGSRGFGPGANGANGQAKGGAIYVDSGTASISGAFSGNSASDAGSTATDNPDLFGAQFSSPATYIVTNNGDSGVGSLRKAIQDANASFGADIINFDPKVEGTIILTSGELHITECVTINGPGANKLQVDGNHASRVFNIGSGTIVNISGLSITNGDQNGGGGGGIHNDHATLTITNCTIRDNSAYVGGGIYNNGSNSGRATLTVTNSTLSGNSGGAGAGGVYNDGSNSGRATLTVTNSTLSGNSADFGGGVYNYGSTGHATLTVISSTLSGNSAANSAANSGGGIVNYGVSGSAVFSVGNTIFDAGASGENIYNFTGTVTSDGHNLSSDGGVTNANGGTGALNATGDQINVTDVKLGPLANNGGPTMTHALLPGSLALDAGDNALASNAGLATDGRGPGFSRVLDAASDADTTPTVDIGALEADPSIEDISDKSTAEDTPLSFIFQVGDSATPFEPFINNLSSNTTLLPNANIIVSDDTPSTRKLTITPAANQNGTATITVIVTKFVNGVPLRMLDTFKLTVTAVNDSPVADSQSVTTNEDTDKSITLTGSDIEGASLAFSVVTGPSNGTLTGTAPNLTYHPNANYNGMDSFTFKVNDGQADSNTATVSIAVGVVNDAPVADSQSVAMDENTEKAITLTGSDVEGAALTFSVVAGPANGTLTGAPPNLTYKPNANYNGTDSFTFKVNDGQLDSNTATVSIAVGMVNEVPIADAQSVTTNENIPKAITLTGSDTDGSVLAFSIVTGPGHGTLSGTAPNLTYTPAVNYSGTDSFTFQTTDGSADSSPATVSITVVGPASHPLNISTRLNVLSGENVLIGGFYITGSAPKKVMVRALGPSLNVGGVPIDGRLGNTVLELFDQTTHQKIATNDNWKVDDATGQSQEATITATTIPPPNELESALVLTLNPGPYSAIVSGKEGSTGVALVEAYDLDTAADSRFANISTRGFVEGGSHVMIGGFILGASEGGSEILVRGIGPSLTGSGVANALPDPRLEIHSENGAVIATNDNWKTDDQSGQSQEAAIIATTIPPTNDAESALLLTLPPGSYTAVLGSNGAATGVALVEIYNLQ